MKIILSLTIDTYIYRPKQLYDHRIGINIWYYIILEPSFRNFMTLYIFDYPIGRNIIDAFFNITWSLDMSDQLEGKRSWENVVRKSDKRKVHIMFQVEILIRSDE